MMLFIILKISLIYNSLAYRVTSYCGHPGLPPDGTLYQINSGRIRFHDGEDVRYLCSTNFQTYQQTRKCVSGRWVGENARCGVAIDNDIQLIKVFNCTDSTNNEILNLNLNQTPNTLRFHNSFHASRVRTGPITVYGSSCYLWQFKLKNPSMIPFLTLDFGTQISHKDLSKNIVKAINSSSKQLDLLTVTPFVSKYRMCRSVRKVDHIKHDPNNNVTYLLTAYHFRCDSITESDYDSETQDMSDMLIVETRANYSRDVNLVAVFLADHKKDPETGKAECGKPETVQTGANFRQSNLGIPQYQFQCNDSFIDVTPNKSVDTNSVHWYSVNCSVNGVWIGTFPSCIPNIQCPGIEYLEASKDASVMIESIENVYYVNETFWVPGEHSYVNYACLSNDHIVVGKLSRVCQKNGKWSHKMPKCTAFLKPESLNSVAQSPWTIIIILSSILIIFLLFVLLFVRKYVSNVRRELTRNGNKFREQTSIYTDVQNNAIYDDCNNSYGTDGNNKVNSQKFENDPDYIELINKRHSTEPLYMPILPPIDE